MTKPHQWLNQIAVAVTAYNPVGQVIGTRTFTYNDKLQLVAETNVMGQLTRQYDLLGRSSSLSLTPSDMSAPSYSVSYDYAGHSGLSSVIGHQSSNSWTYSYLSNSDLIAGISNTVAGVISMRAYEPNRNLIISVANRHGATLISSFDYENDAVGRRTLRVDNTATTNLFSYNIRSELTGAIMSTNTFSYAFDQIGNRTEATEAGSEWDYIANELNQYTSITNDGSPVAVAHDADGNMITNGDWTYFWNGENHLVGASNSEYQISFSYDYMGRRFRKVVNGVTNNFIYDGWAMIQETSSSGTTNSYVYGLDLSGSLQGAGTIGGILSASFNGTNAYFCYDGNGNVMSLVDTSGVVVAEYEYSPFGQCIKATGPMAAANPFRFATQYYDKGTGWIMFPARPYSPTLGRFISRDPIHKQGGVHLYAYVGNNPITYIDPWGLITFDFGSDCKPEHQQKFKDLEKQLMDTLDKAIKLVETPDIGGPGSGTAQESAMKECFGSSSDVFGYEIALNKVRGNLKKLKDIFDKKKIGIECDPCCEEGTTGWVLMLGSISLSKIHICTDWIEEANAKQLASSLLHEATHEYLGFGAKNEWYYMESGGWISPEGTYKPGVTPPSDLIFKTPDAYKCLFGRCW